MAFGRAISVDEERRAAERLEISCPARLRTSYSVWQGELTDISAAGARFKAHAPPKKGVEALLEWDSFETFCQVIWAKADECGVRFEREIPELAVDQSVSRNQNLEPSASVGNIPIGKRRSATRNADRFAVGQSWTHDEKLEPSANLGNIPRGKRRSATDGVEFPAH
jgi:hypothetical protein